MLPGQSERGGVCGQCLVKWTETECGLSCISHWLPCYALALGITLFWCASKTRKAKEEADSYTGDAEHLCFPRAWPCSTFPQNLSVGCSLAAVHVTLSSIPWHLREMQFSNVACRFLFWVTLQVLSLNTVSHMHACFPAHRKKEWARNKLLVSIQFPWSDRCCICRYSPCPHPHGGLGRNLSWAWREHWAEGDSLWWACRSPCYWADGSPVSSQLEVFHVHGSIPKYKEF